MLSLAMSMLSAFLSLFSYTLFVSLFKSLSILVKPAQVRLPEDCNNSGKDTPRLRRDESKREGRHEWPDLPRVLPRHRHSIQYPPLRLFQSASRQQALHAEEVGVEDRRKERLIDHNLDSDTDEVRRIIEVPSQEEEPLIARDAADQADSHGS